MIHSHKEASLYMLLSGMTLCCCFVQMFDNISKLQFVQGPGGESIANAMISSEGEMMEYRKGILAEGKVHSIPTHSYLWWLSIP